MEKHPLGPLGDYDFGKLIHGKNVLTVLELS